MTSTILLRSVDGPPLDHSQTPAVFDELQTSYDVNSRVKLVPSPRAYSRAALRAVGSGINQIFFDHMVFQTGQRICAEYQAFSVKSIEIFDTILQYVRVF
jgi:hypothetical protein